MSSQVEQVQGQAVSRHVQTAALFIANNYQVFTKGSMDVTNKTHTETHITYGRKFWRIAEIMTEFTLAAEKSLSHNNNYS